MFFVLSRTYQNKKNFIYFPIVKPTNNRGVYTPPGWLVFPFSISAWLGFKKAFGFFAVGVESIFWRGFRRGFAVGRAVLLMSK